MLVSDAALDHPHAEQQSASEADLSWHSLLCEFDVSDVTLNHSVRLATAAEREDAAAAPAWRVPARQAFASPSPLLEDRESSLLRWWSSAVGWGLSSVGEPVGDIGAAAEVQLGEDAADVGFDGSLR